MNPEHNRRRRILAIGLVVLAASLLLGLTVLGTDTGRGGKESVATEPNPWDGPDYDNSGVVGDTDDDGKVSEAEAEALEVTEASVETVRDIVAPTKGGDTVLLTPSGDDWWTFVTSQAPSLGVDTAPAPGQADWYSYTEGRAFKSASQVNAYYQAIHVAFDDNAAAIAWVTDLSANGYGGGAMFAIRDQVVTVTPTWVDAETEPYPDVDADALATIDAKVGLWQINFDEQAKNRGREASDPVAYTNFWNTTGLSGTWTATSPRPDLPWVGNLDGFDPSRIDVMAAAAHINTSLFECGRDRKCRGDMGISEAIGDMYLADGDGAFAGEETLAPSELSDDTALVLVLDGAFRGMINESYSLTGVPKTEYLVSTTGTLTIRFDFIAPKADAA